MWPKILKDMGVCAEIRNYARSGASYKTSARTEGEERQNLEYQITVALNDLSNPNGAFEVDDFVPDIVIFALGTNDGVPNDTYDSAMSKTVLAADGYSVDTTATLANLDKSKFCEAVRSAFMRTRIAFPFAQFYCVLPIQRANNEVNGEAINAYLKQMAERYGCIIVNGFAESGIIRDTNTWNALGLTLKDGLHPNDKGQNMLFRAIYGALKSHYTITSSMNS
jgi:lysophospholipase L1-like esterase